MERVVRAKKPWVLAAVSLLLLGCCLGLFYKTLAANQVNKSFTDTDGNNWDTALKGAKKEVELSKRFVSKDTEQKVLLEKFNVIAAELSSSVEGRASWIEIYSALYQALPRDAEIAKALEEQTGDSLAIDPKAIGFAGRKEMYIDHIETVFHKNLGTWHSQIKRIFAGQGARTTDSFGAAKPVADAIEAPDAAAPAILGDGEGVCCRTKWKAWLGHRDSGSPFSQRRCNEF